MDGPRRDDIPTQSQGQKSSAEPHPKDGHIRLPNEVVENLARLEANGSQYRIIFAIWRRTLGWQKSGEWKNDPYPIGLGHLVKATGLDRRQVRREVNELTERNILRRDPGPRKSLISFNLDYTSWVGVKLPPPPDTKSKLGKKPKETVAAPTTDDWRYDQREDLAWLRQFRIEFPELAVAHVHACTDYYSGLSPLAPSVI